jgi:hypothetical protein
MEYTNDLLERRKKLAVTKRTQTHTHTSEIRKRECHTREREREGCPIDMITQRESIRGTAVHINKSSLSFYLSLTLSVSTIEEREIERGKGTMDNMHTSIEEEKKIDKR